MASFNEQKKQQNEEESEAITTLAVSELAAVWERITYTASHAPLSPEDRVNIPLDCLFAHAAQAAHEFGLSREAFVQELGEHFDDTAADAIETDPEADEPVSVSIKAAPELKRMPTAQEIIDGAPEL